MISKIPGIRGSIVAVPVLLAGFFGGIAHPPCRAAEPESDYPPLGDCVAEDSLSWRTMSRQANRNNPWRDSGLSVYQRAREARIPELRDFLGSVHGGGAGLAGKNERGDQLLHCVLDPRGHPDAARTPELDAARLQAVDLLIRSGADVNAANGRRETPLQLAVMEGNPAIVRRLLEEGAVVNGSHAPGEHPVQLAVAKGDIPLTALLLDAGADINPAKLEVECGDAPLELAVRLAKVPMAEYLLERMAKEGGSAGWSLSALLEPLVNHPLPQPVPESRAREAEDRLTLARMLLEAGASPDAVHAAAAGNHGGIAKLLLEAGGDPDSVNDSLSMERGRTPLHEAASHANLELVNALLAKGADVAAATNARRCQAIHHAIRPSSSLSLGLANPWQASDAQRVAVVRALLKAGADPMAPANERWTPLHDAVSAGNLEMVKLLLDAGADPNAASGRGTRPLHLDAFPHGLAVAKVLVERGASVEVGPAPEVGFIHTAARRGDIDLVTFYLEKGLPVDLAGGGFRLQPIHDAAEAGQLEMVEFLLARGARIDAPTFTRKQPLHLAAGRGWVRLVRFLLDRGADPAAVDSHGRTPAGWARAQHQAACVALLEGGEPAPESKE